MVRVRAEPGSTVRDGTAGRGSDVSAVGRDCGGLQALAALLERAHAAAPVDLASCVEDAARELGASGVRMLLVDYGQQLLFPMTPDGRGEPVPINGSLVGRAYTSGGPVAVDAAGDRGVIVATPLLDGIERLGVLELTFADRGPAAGQDELVRASRRFADLLCQFVVTKGSYTDEFHLVRSAEPMTLAAQMQWQLLPPLTAHTPAVTLAGQVEPAYEVGGDAFDYAVNDEVAFVGVFDAMGHGVAASVTTALAVGAYRNCRRRHLDLTHTVAFLDDVLGTEFTDDRYVTAALGELDLASGTLRLVSAGHPAPLLLRDRHVVHSIQTPVGLPLGMGLGWDARALPVTEVTLQPGDRVLFVTDGVVDARGSDGRRFGADRLIDLVERAALDQMPLAELARAIVLGVHAYQDGKLSDDASLLLLEYNGHPGTVPVAGTAPRS